MKKALNKIKSLFPWGIEQADAILFVATFLIFMSIFRYA